MSDLSTFLVEVAKMMVRPDPCRDYWSWFGHEGRECELPFGHTGAHKSGPIRWAR